MNKQNNKSQISFDGMNTPNNISADQVSVIDLLTLVSVPKIGNTRAMELINSFESTSEIFSAPARELSKALNLPLNVGKAIVDAGKERDKFEKMIARAKGDDINIVTLWDDNYPKKLKSIHFSDCLPTLHPITSTKNVSVSAILFTGNAKWNGDRLFFI